MTAYRFRAARLDGELLNGTVEAGSPAAALTLVEARGLFPVLVEEAPPHRRTAAPIGELANILAGLAALLDAGLPMDRALAAAQETAPLALQPLLAAAQAQVREGAALSSALDADGAVPALVIGYLKAGERSGRLATSIQRAAGELERSAETRARVRAALTYPAFLLVAGGVSVTAIVGFVVPRFAALLTDQGRALPAATRLLISASMLLSRGAIPTFAATVIAVVVMSRWMRTAEGRLAVHRALLELPILGDLRLRLATARACGALGSLLEGGVPILPALDLARDASDDAAVGRRIAAARIDVERGEPLATALKRHAALTPVALRLAAFGERAGRQAAFLEHAARLESSAAQRAIQRTVTLLEPVMILLFGAVVAFVAAALLQAVYSVRPGS